MPETGVYMEPYPAECKVQVGVFDPALPGPENRMRILNNAFDEQAVHMVTKLAQVPGEWGFLDEIGYLESDCLIYMNAIRSLLARKRIIAAVRQNTPFLQELRNRADVFCVDLDKPFGNTGCVIMASGQSRRFGANKLLADFRGEPMIHRILCATDSIFSRRVVVTRYPEIAALCKKRGIDVVLHDQPHRSDTIRLGLQALGDVQGCMFCAADQPLVSQPTIASIVLSSMNDPTSIWRTCFDETPGLPALFPQWTFAALMDLPQGKGGGFVIRMHPEHVRTIPVQNEAELMDADDPETLAKLAAIDFEPLCSWRNL